MADTAQDTVTVEEMMELVNSAANMVIESAQTDPDTTTLIDFLVNAVGTLHSDPDATVDDVIADNWDEEGADVIRAIVIRD